MQRSLSMFCFWTHFVIAIILLFETSSTTATINTQSYKLLTRQGFETSYPEEGGKMVMTCTSDDPAEEVYIVDAHIKEVTEKNKTKLEWELVLTGKSMGNSYRCVPEPTDGGGSFKVHFIFCDPFELTPPAKNCQDGQVCNLDKADQHVCVPSAKANCFLAKDLHAMQTSFKASLYEYSVACFDNVNLGNNKDEFGMCHAKVTNMEKRFNGLADEYANCPVFTNFTVNSKEVQQDGVLYESRDPSRWNLEFESRKAVEDISCVLSNAAGKSVAHFNGKQKSNLTYSKGSSQIKLPEKLWLLCDFKAKEALITTKVVSAYVVVYSNDISQYQPKVTIHENASNKKIRDLECSVEVPNGLEFVLWWKNAPEPKDQNDIKKLKNNSPLRMNGLKYEKHEKSVEYTCIANIYAYEYPFSFKLIKLNDLLVIATHSVGPKDFGKSEGDAGEEDGKKNPETKNNNKEATSNGKSKSNKTTIIVVVVIVVIFMICGILGAIIYWKKVKKQPASSAIVVSTKPPDPLLECLKKTAHSCDNAFASSFFEKLKNILELDEDCLMATLMQDEKNKRVSTEWVQLQNMKNSYDSGFIPTCRYPLDRLLTHTWAYRENPSTILSKVMVDERDSLSAPVSLHMNIIKNLKNSFFVCQAPLEKEIPLFIELLIKKNIKKILFLSASDDVEDGVYDRTNQFYRIFDLKTNIEKTYGKFSVMCTATAKTKIRSDTHKAAFVTQSIVIKRMSNNSTHSIQMLNCQHFNKYISVENIQSVFDIFDCLEQDGSISCGPVLVYCSNGLNRSAVFVACVICYQYLQSNDMPMGINIFELVKYLRSQRLGMIHTVNQYAFIYWAVGHFLELRLKAQLPEDNVKTEIVKTVVLSKRSKPLRRT